MTFRPPSQKRALPHARHVRLPTLSPRAGPHRLREKVELRATHARARGMDLSPVTAVGLLCPSLALLYAVGASFARHRLSGGTGSGGRDVETAVALFGTCFACTVGLYLLVLLDVGAHVPRETMLLSWRTALSCLLLHVLVVTPSCAVYAAATSGRAPSAGGPFPRGSSTAGTRVAAAATGVVTRGVAAAVLADGALLYALWHLGASSGELSPPGGQPTLTWQYVLSRCTARAAVLGVALAAVLAGYAAVWWPFTTASVFALEADPGATGRLERAYLAALSQQVVKKKRIALLLAEQSASSSAGGDDSSAQPQRGALLAWAAKLVTSATSASSAASAAAAAALDGLRLEVALLDDLAKSLSQEVTFARAAAQRTASTRSWRGRLDDGAALGTSLFCVVHLYRSLRHLAFGEADGDMTASLGLVAATTTTSSSTATSDAPQRGAGIGSRAALRWYATVASVLLIAFVIASSLRTFFDLVQRLAQRLAKAGWASRRRGGKRRLCAPQGSGKDGNAPAAVWGSARPGYMSPGAIILFVACETTGLYGLASVLLLRDKLPPRPREVLGLALGDVPFRFYEDAFDAIYVASALTTATVLAWQHTQQKRALRNEL